MVQSVVKTTVGTSMHVLLLVASEVLGPTSADHRSHTFVAKNKTLPYMGSVAARCVKKQRIFRRMLRFVRRQ